MIPSYSCTAHHEAAHAVVAWWLGYDVVSIEMYDEQTQKQGRDGQMRYHFPVLKSKRLQAAAEIVITWAAPLCERAMGFTDDIEVGPSDARDIAKRLPELGDNDEQRTRRAAELGRLAEEIVERYKSGIGALASALLANGRIIERDEIKHLLGEPLDPRGAMEVVARRLAEADLESA